MTMIKQDAMVSSVWIPYSNVQADLAIPTGARAIVLFAHGNGSDRHSTRNEYVAKVLHNSSIATLLVDLLTPEEKAIDIRLRNIRFNVGLLSERVEVITEWIRHHSGISKLPIGYFGSSTGSAAALIAASRLRNNTKRDVVTAIVSRGGRPDLVNSEDMNGVTSATLFITGGNDDAVIGMNKRALRELNHSKARELAIIPHAGHLFEEPGAMEHVAHLATRWFEFYLLGNGTPFTSKFLYNTRSTRGFLSTIKEMSGIHMRFKDRLVAGQILGSMLLQYRDSSRKGDVTVLGIPRGGAIVGHAVAAKLSTDFDIVVTRRLRNPNDSEDAIGAITNKGYVYFDTNKIESLSLSDDYLELEMNEQVKEIERRISLYRPHRREYKINDRKVILVDDGSATGASIIVTARWIRAQNPRELIIAVPVISRQAARLVRAEADQVRTIRQPRSFKSVEEFYQDFRTIADEEIFKMSSL